MYWQKRFDRSNPNEKEEKLILEIRATNKDYGYRRICGELHIRRFIINKKKGQRIMQKLKLQVSTYTRKRRKCKCQYKNVKKVENNYVQFPAFTPLLVLP